MIVFVRLLPLVLAAIVLIPIAPTPGFAQGAKPKPPIEIVSLPGHDGSVVSVVFSPDGTRALTGGVDQIAHLWDAASWKLLRSFEGHASSLRSVAFSPDGARVLTASRDKTVKLWDVQSGQLLRTFEGHAQAANSAVFSPDGTQVLSASDDKTARLWDAGSGRLIREFSGHAGEVPAAMFSADGKRLLTASRDKTVKLWDVQSGQIERTFEARFAVTSVALALDGETFLAGTQGLACARWRSGVCEGSTSRALVEWWSLASGQVLRTFDTGREVRSVAFSPDGKRVLAGGGSMQIWEAASGELMRKLEPLSGNFDAVAFSPDGTRIVSGDRDAVRMWDATTGELLRTIRRHTGGILSVAFSPDGRRMVAGGLDKTAKLWDATSGRLLHTFESKTDRILTSVAFSPDGRRLLTATDHGTVTLWNVPNGRSLLSVNGYTVRSAAFSPDGKRVLAGGGWVTLWDATTGQLLRKLLPERGCNSVAFSPDGKRVLTGGYAGIVELRDTVTGELVRSFKGAAIRWVAFSPDGARILAASGHSVLLWDAETGRLLRSFEGHAANVTSVAFSPDGARILSGSDDRTIRLWDAATGVSLHVFGERRPDRPDGDTGWDDGGTLVAFSRDGRRVLSGATDGLVRLWAVDARELLATFIGAADGEWIAFTPEGFFEASPGGTNLISAQRGDEILAMERAYQALHRPDLVQEKLAGDPRGRVKAAAEKLNFD
jgi:WD40 repeat protein